MQPPWLEWTPQQHFLLREMTPASEDGHSQCRYGGREPLWQAVPGEARTTLAQYRLCFHPDIVHVRHP